MNISAEKNEGTKTGFLWSFWVRLLRACVRFWKQAGKQTTKYFLLYPLANVVSFSKKLVSTFCRKSAIVYDASRGSYTAYINCFTLADVQCLCDGCKMSPPSRHTTLIQRWNLVVTLFNQYSTKAGCREASV